MTALPGALCQVYAKHGLETLSHALMACTQLPAEARRACAVQPQLRRYLSLADSGSS